MAKILDIFQIPGKNEAGIALAGERPKHLKVGSQIKSGDTLTAVTGIPCVRPLGSIHNGTFSVLANSENLKVGDDVEII